MACALLSLGSNLGDRPAQLARALELLCSSADCTLLRRSRWYRTQSVGGPPDQPAFLNGAAVVETALSPEQLHARLFAVEAKLGRQRDVRWGARTIDLDLLLYGTQVIETAELIVPHPRMCVRRFVLVPAAEIAADWIHPALGWTLDRLLAHLDTAAPYLAITGPPAAGKSELAEILAHACGATLLRDPRVEPFIAALDEGGSSRGLPTEEQLIANRQRALAAIEPGRSIRFVSDFWIGQSLVFAQAFLPAEQVTQFGRRFEQATSMIAAPKLLAVLDAPSEQLWRRLLDRGHVTELGLDVPQIESLRLAFAHQWSRPAGPLLRLTGMTTNEALAELRAAVEAMDVRCTPEAE